MVELYPFSRANSELQQSALEKINQGTLLAIEGEFYANQKKLTEMLESYPTVNTATEKEVYESFNHGLPRIYG